MKKLLLALSFLTLLVGCEETLTEVETTEVQEAELSEQVESVVSFHNPVLIKELAVNDEGYVLTVSPLDWPSVEEGTCILPSEWREDKSSDKPICNAVLNVVNDDPSDSISFTLSTEALVYTSNFRADPNSTFEMTVEEFKIALEEKSSYFDYVPFDIEFDLSDQVTSIKERYTP